MQREATRVQKIMLALMSCVGVLLLVWLGYELVGIFDPAPEDTYSEWFFDLPLFALIPLSLVHVVAGVLAVWAGLHFIEGYIRRHVRSS